MVAWSLDARSEEQPSIVTVGCDAGLRRGCMGSAVHTAIVTMGLQLHVHTNVVTDVG
jgi:hypothetical protein